MEICMYCKLMFNLCYFIYWVKGIKMQWFTSTCRFNPVRAVRISMKYCRYGVNQQSINHEINLKCKKVFLPTNTSNKRLLRKMILLWFLLEFSWLYVNLGQKKKVYVQCFYLLYFRKRWFLSCQSVTDS